MEPELDRESRFHIESQVADRVALGMMEAQAKRPTLLM